VIKAYYNSGQMERLCLIIDKCRRQKLCKRAQTILAAAPLRVMAPTSILECNSHKIKIHVYFLSGHFEFGHLRHHFGIFLIYVDTIFGDLRRECLHQP
jgi:hypothetical protein